MPIHAVGQQATCEAGGGGRRAVSHTRHRPQCDVARAICAAHVLLPPAACATHQLHTPQLAYVLLN